MSFFFTYQIFKPLKTTTGGGEPWNFLQKPFDLLQTIHYKVGQICEEIQKDIGITFSKTAVASISELTFR